MTGASAKPQGPWTFRFVVACIALFLFAAGLRVAVNNVKNFSPADEQIYLYYADALRSHGGPGCYGTLVNSYLSNPGNALFPGPNRYGHILSTYAFLSLTGEFSRAALATWSTLCSILILPLSFLIGYRAHGRWAGFLSLLFVGTSPLLLGLGRRALSDVPHCLVCLGAILAFYEYFVRRRRNCLAALGVLLLLILQASIKEVGFLLFLALGLALVTYMIEYRSWFLDSWLLLIAAPVLNVLILGLLSDDLWAYFRIGRFMLAAAPGNAYLSECYSGPVHHLLVDFSLISPLLVLSVPALVTKFPRSDRSPALADFILRFSLASLLVFSVLGTLQNHLCVRFVVVEEVLLRIFVACCLAAIFERWRAAGRWPASAVRRSLAVVLIVAGAAAIDLLIFRKGFLIPDTYDPALVNLLGAFGMLPS